ncbi:MAG: hypothetical protein ACYC4D_04175 [Thermoleophilia bacterium]
MRTIPYIAFLLLLLVVVGCSENSRSDIDWGGLHTSSRPIEQETVLSECAKTACVAAKAAELEAQVEAVRKAEEEAARNQEALAAEQSCEQMLAEWEALYSSLPSYRRPPMPCGPYAGYSSAWTAGQAQWEAMSEEEKIAFAREHGGTYEQN